MDAYGEFFNKNGEEPVFEAPLSSGIHAIFKNTIWIGGKTEDNELHLAQQTKYDTPGGNRTSDFAPGPVSENDQYTLAFANRYDRVWAITREKIEQHRAQFNDAGYTVPDIIKNWPAQKVPNLGVDHHPAPFVDSNDNGEYDPENGDYPKIRGDKAILCIVNDERATRPEGDLSNKMQVEIRGMLYAYDSAQNPALNNTVFINYNIRNQSDNDYQDVFLGNFTDFDVGFPFDDYAGCDTQRNLFYGYNGNNQDALPNFYGERPPAVGGAFLNTPLNSFLAYNNNLSDTGNPETAFDYYNYLKGMWKDSTPMTVGGSGYKSSDDTTRYLFFGDPQKPGEWHERSENTDPFDRQGIGVAGPFNYAAGESECLDMAFIFARDSTPNDTTSYLKSVGKLKDRTEAIQAFYERQGFNCKPIQNDPTGLSEKKEGKPFNFYPNPADNAVFIQLPRQHEQPLNLQLMNTNGKNLMDQTIPAGETSVTLNLESLPKGIYPLQIQNNEAHYQGMLIKQ